METRIEVGARLSDEVTTQLRGVFSQVRERYTLAVASAPVSPLWPVTALGPRPSVRESALGLSMPLIREVEPFLDGAFDLLSLAKAIRILDTCIDRRWIDGGEIFLTMLVRELQDVQDALALTGRFGNDFLKRLAESPARGDDPVLVGDFEALADASQA